MEILQPQMGEMAFYYGCSNCNNCLMSAKYGDTEKAPSWEFTAMLHSALLVMAIIAIVIYEKHIKRKLMEYETDSGNKDN